MFKNKMSFLLMAIFFSAVFFQPTQIFGLGTCSPAPVGLVAWYPGDGNAFDIRGGNNGVPRLSTTYAPGRFGQAFQFSSSNGSANTQVNVPDSPALRLSNSLTIEAWIKPTAPGAPDNPILVKGDLSSGGSQPYSILFVNAAPNDNRIIFRVGNNSTFDSLVSSANIPLNIYTHIAVTYDGATMTIYINGVFDSSKTTSIGTLNQNSLPLAIGGGAADFNGAIDELLIYNRALSVSDIISPAGKCKPTATVAPGGLAAWFAGDGNANDISGNGDQGTLDGATFAVGKVGQAFRFNGSGGRVLVGNPANLQLQTFTIEGWIKRASSTIVTNNPSDTGYGLIFAYGQGGYGIGIQPDGRLFSTKFGGLITNSTLMITDTNYHHVVVIVSGTSLLFYVDGAGESQTISGQTYTFNTNAAIGARGDDVLNSFYGDIDELSVYNRVLSAAEIQSIVNAGIAGKLKQVSTPTGFAALAEQTRNATNNKAKSLQASADNSDFSPQSVNVIVGDATVTFSGVTTAGATQEIPLDPNVLPPLPSGTWTGLNYDIATSAVYTGTATVCFNLPALAGVFPNLRIYHLENFAWVNRTAASGNTPSNFCTTPLTSLSPFAIVQAVPTAASVSISGRVMIGEDAGLVNATVTMTDSRGSIRTARSSSFGYYRFDEVAVGENYVISISSKRYQFAPQVVFIDEERADLDFSALP